MNWSPRFLVIWMVATTLHFPVPFLDGDDLKSGESACSQASPQRGFDIDFVLLGCYPPDDPDDGPLGNDPDNGSNSPFGDSYFNPGLKSQADDLGAWDRSVGHEIARSESNGSRRAYGLSRFDRNGLLNFSFGKRCRNGMAKLRC